MKSLLLILLGCVFSLSGYSQENQDYLLWNSNQKLTIDDFAIKKNQCISGLSFAQFTIDFSVNGFDFVTKNFNKKVRNSIIKTGSWIDTSQNVAHSLRYQQTLFDIAEIYTRHFRKDLRDNRRKIINGLSIAQELNAKNSADFSKRILVYDKETESGTNEAKQKLWELQIQKELDELSEFEYGK